MNRELTGRHVLAIFGTGFAVIIGVNLVLATQAVRTFPGLEVKNSYVASQSFDRDRTAQQALGWQARARIDGGLLRLDLTGADGLQAPAQITEARLGRASHVAEDRLLDLRRQDGALVAEVPDLPAGQWHLWLDARAADGTAFRQRLDLRVTE